MSDTLRASSSPITREAIARAMSPMSFNERIDAMIRANNFNGMQLTGNVKQGAPDWRGDLQSNISEQLGLSRAGRGRLNKVMNVGEVVSGVGGAAAGVADTAQASSPTERNLMGALTALSIIPGMGAVTKYAKPALKNALYRSRLGPAIEAMPMDKMTGQQAASHFSKFPGGVGSDELNYTGVQGLLTQPQVTKAGLLDQYRANPLEIKDVIKGRPASAEDYPIIEKDGYFRIYNKQGGMESREYLSRAEAQQHLETEILPFDRGTDPTQFGGPKTTLPGGDDYQELLMTLPQKPLPKGYSVAPLNGHPSAKFTLVGPDGVGSPIGGNTAEEALENAKIKIGKDTSYSSGHYDEPNVLAHSRYNTRNVDGDKTLFIEEIQSDWHQTGRNQGYKGDIDYDTLRAKQQKVFEEKSAIGTDVTAQGYDATQSQQSRYMALDNEYKAIQKQLDGNANAVPDAPYKSTDKWQGLAFSRMVRQAADGGHDRIAWTPGKVQADRYDLSKKVGEINYEPTTKKLRVYPKSNDDFSPFINEIVEPENLPDFIGKEASERLIASKQKKFTQGSPDGIVEKYHHAIKGKDLEIGGEGMKSFYDKMMVKTANKFAKKYGQKVEVKSMGNAAKEVWSLKLTPEMKKDILKGGVALSGAGVAATSLMGQEEGYY
jgi:hypothetical protein